MSTPELVAYTLTNLLPSLLHALSWRPDVIHTHFAVPTGVVALITHILAGVPYVLTAHLGDVPEVVPQETNKVFRFIKPLTMPIWKQAAATTCVSEYTQHLTMDAYQIKPQIIYNGVDLNGCCPNSTHESSGTPRILFIGRFRPQKNPLFALDVLS